MKFWLAKKRFELVQGLTLEQAVESETQPHHFRYEVKNALGQWEVVPDSYFSTQAAQEESNV